jgi:hypothetical protein
MAFSDGAIQAIDRKKAATYLLLQNLGGQMEAEAKQNVPWKDRTTHARQGLKSDVDKNDSELILYLAYSVEYGIWLELACKTKEKRGTDDPGPYAIVIPSIEKYLPQIKQSVRDLWS